MSKKTRKAQVVVAAIDSERQSFCFLLMQTNEKRGSFWQNITGKIEENETYDEGALRETIEETGLNVEYIVDMIDLKLTHEFVDERKRDVHEKSFLFIVDKRWPVKIDPHEHQGFKWVQLESIHPEMVKHKGNFEAIESGVRILKSWDH
jgi:8-oxo-dGTP pyrophosphatase MutT (NUDIX family)